MKKAGIVTMAFGSKNYGGILQAYALASYLKQKGCISEIIRYDYSSGKKLPSVLERWNKASLSEKATKIRRNIKYVPKLYITKCSNYLNRHNLGKRDDAIRQFHRKYMPYSKNIFSWNTVNSCVSDYDVFIAGSDQIWNVGWINEVFLLDFVPDGKEKIAYAVSTAQDVLTEEQSKMLRTSLKKFNAVSVREQTTVRQLAELGISSELVCDPTLLLTREDWNGICSTNQIEGSYIFCYFLGNNSVMRKAAARFAQSHHLKIVTIPYLLGNVRWCDIGFGDEKLYSVSPSEFLSLVRYADYVFTDSFHGCIFSYIYQKQFFAFDRIDSCSSGMSSRIDTLMHIFNTESRFFSQKRCSNLYDIDSAPDILYSDFSDTLYTLKNKSKQFLNNHIHD